MNELLKVNYDNERITLSARELHGFLGIGTEFAKWMQRMCEYGFSENQDYRVLSKMTITQKVVDHQLIMKSLSTWQKKLQ